jgi:ubiquinone/menaquinone biosynthesis C-methylase UbiE
MSSLALMRFLEGAPERYDAGMRLITLGRVGRVHRAVARAALDGEATGAAKTICAREILEIGCGSGAVTSLLLAGGARVTALDQSPTMLEQARKRIGRTASSTGGAVTWLERTASEIDTFPAGSFDAIVASLSLSEMASEERAFVLARARTRLRPGGILVIADEVRPRSRWQRWLAAAMRLPQAMLGWLLAGSVSQPLADLSAELEAAGFRCIGEQRWLLGTLAVLTAVARKEDSAT